MGLQADHVLDLLLHPFRFGAGQVDLIDDREHIQVMIQRQIYVGQRLRFNPLRRVHHQHRAVTGRQRAAHFIVKVHMARRIDQVQDILLPVLRLVDGAHRLGFDGDPPLPFQVHVIQHLLLHLPAGKQSRLLDDPVRQGGFPVVDMGNDTKISDSALIYGHAFPHFRAAPLAIGPAKGFFSFRKKRTFRTDMPSIAKSTVSVNTKAAARGIIRSGSPARLFLCLPLPGGSRS